MSEKTETWVIKCSLCGMRYSTTYAKCPGCHPKQSIDPNPPTCKSCGKELEKHIGHEGLCRQLEEAKAYMSEITETCPHCYGTGCWGDNGKNVCPHCDGEGEVSANPPTCKSYGKELEKHIGHEGLCRQLEEAKAYLREYHEAFARAGDEYRAGAIDAFLKELES